MSGQKMKLQPRKANKNMVLHSKSAACLRNGCVLYSTTHPNTVTNFKIGGNMPHGKIPAKQNVLVIFVKSKKIILLTLSAILVSQQNEFTSTHDIWGYIAK